MANCIRTDLDCADICAATARVVARQSGESQDALRAMLTACSKSCEACEQECRIHSDKHDHCRDCAEACKRCKDACDKALSSL